MVGSSPTLLFSEYFGTLNLDEAAILSFPQGLPGFENELRFAAIQIPGQQPMVYLQSVVTPGLCLLTFPVHAIEPSYRVEISDEDRDTLGLTRSESAGSVPAVLALAIVAVEPEEGPTANLAAPLVVNLKNHIAVQAFQANAGLSYTHRLTPSPRVC